MTYYAEQEKRLVKRTAKEMNSPTIEIISRNHTYGEVKILINGREYLYKFPALEYFENLKRSYWKNKGIFLSKIKPFLSQQ